MKRDMDLIRKIILAARDTDGYLQGLPGVDQKTFGHHVAWIAEAGLAHCQVQWGGDGPVSTPILAFVERLTWAGHDFADSIKDETIWSKATEMVIKPTASFTFDILKDVISNLIRSSIPGL